MGNALAQILAWRRLTPLQRIELLLGVGFAAALLFRFAYVFITSPMGHLFSDPGRHWENALHLTKPFLWGSADPLLYQVYLAAVQFLSAGRWGAINFYTGLLSAGMAFFWFKALDEVLPRAWALAGGIAIALTPSLIMIFSYFMNETLLLALLGAALWLALRAMRLKTIGAFAWAAAVWAMASYTRFIALPLALVCLAILLFEDMRRILPKLCIVAVAYGGLAVPACWHSQVNLHYCAPFGLSYVNAAYRAANTKSYYLETSTAGNYVFSSPSFYTHPFEPLSDWMRPQQGQLNLHVILEEGRASWEKELARVKAEYGPTYTWLQLFIDNAIVLFFDPSWPDNNPNYMMGWLAVANRWLWLPLTLMVAGMAWQSRKDSWNLRLGLPLLLALLTIALLMFQNGGVMEGRYRKPAEPLLIAALVVLLYERKQRKAAMEKEAFGIRLKRDTALKIHYLLDQWVPPYLRDSRWFMGPPLRFVFHQFAGDYMDFKEKAFAMSEEEFRDTYQRVSKVAFQRETDLNEASVKRILEEVRGPKVLEVGCGKGYLAKLLADAGHDVTVADIVLQDEVKALEPRVKLFEANMENLPFADQEFDTVICTHTLEHVRNLSRSVAELRRVGKCVLIVVPRQRPYEYTFDLHLNFFPYPHSLLSAFGKTPAEASCEDVDGDLFYMEHQ